MRNLLPLACACWAFLQSISLPSVFPLFLTDDFAPYLVAQTFSPGSVLFNVTATGAFQVTVNSTAYVGSFSGNKTITLANLAIGAHQLALSNGNLTYTFLLLVAGNQTFTHTVSANGVNCSPDCGIYPTSSSLVLNAGSQVQAMIFNNILRVAVWTGVQGSQTYPGVAMDNYLVVMEGSGFQLHKAFKAPKPNQPVALALKTSLGFTGLSFTPRFNPQRTIFAVTPNLDSGVGFDLALNATCYASCSISVDSSTAIFQSVAAVSSSWSSVFRVMANDTIIVTFTDPTGEQSPEYYTVAVSVKDRDKYLKSLSIVSGTTKDSYAAYTSYPALNAAVKGSQLSLVESFSPMRTQYSLPDLDYNSSFSLVVLTDTESPLSSLTIQGNSTAISPYWSSSKSYIPVIGSNVITLKVVAQDVGYSSQTTIAFRMLNNDTGLQSIAIAGGQWSQPFSSNVAEYSVGLPAEWGSLPLVVQTNDPRAFISLYSTFSLPFQNLTGVLNATIPLPQLAFYNQSFVLRVNAETRGLVKQTVVWVWKEDRCGNGLRYTSAETCDDGNLIDGDGCDSLCKTESGFVCAGGSVSQKDICTLINSTDPGTNSTDPGTNSTDPGTNSTDPDTNSTDPGTNSTDLPLCGNGVLDPLEECDDSNEENGDGCSQDCLYEHICGDGIRITPEACDDGNLVNGDGCSSTCALEDGWMCTINSLYRDVCQPSSLQLRVIDTHEQYFTYQYMGVSFGFPFVVLLIAVVAGSIFLRLKAVGGAESVWLAAGAAYLIMLLQLLFILHDVGLEGDRYLMFAGFSWTHLRFDVEYPPFRGRRLADIAPRAEVRFFDFALVFILIAACAVVAHGVLYVLRRPWSSLDYWAQIYLVLFQIIHIPILYYAIRSLMGLPKMTTAYECFNATAALVAVVVLLSVVLLYAVTLRRAWSESQYLHFESIRSILCPGIKKPMQTLKKFIGMSATELSPSEVPKRMNRSFDETAVRDKDGVDEADIEESTARGRIMSADTQKKKMATPDFSQYFSKSRLMAVKGQGWSLTYLIQFTETMVCTIVLASGHSKLGCLVPAVVCQSIVAGVLLWQRPFVSLRYNLTHVCARIAFALILLLLAIGAEVDDAGIIAILFVLLGVVCALQVAEFCCLLMAALLSVKGPQEQPKEQEPQPGVREFTLHDDHLSLEPPESIPDERHPSSDVINEAEVDFQIGLEQE